MRTLLAAALLLAVTPLLASTSALAQISGTAFSGFSGNSKNPINIEADELEVIDGEKRALFKGNVTVTQGKSTLRTSQLEVIYSGDGSGGQGDISMLNLSGGVVAKSDNNTATGDTGSFDVKREIVTLSGDVVLSQGQNVAKGCKLVASLKQNTANLSRCKGQRVITSITPNQ